MQLENGEKIRKQQWIAVNEDARGTNLPWRTVAATHAGIVDDRKDELSFYWCTCNE